MDEEEKRATNETKKVGFAARELETCGAGQRESGKIFLKLEIFAREERYLQGELLRECISRCAGGTGLKDIGKVHIEMLRKLAEMPCGRRQDLPGGITASRRDGVILFEKKRGTEAKNAPSHAGGRRETGKEDGETKAAGEEYILDLNGRVDIGDMTVITRTILREQFDDSEILSEKKCTKWLSCDTIKNNVCCRKRKTGDYLAVNSRGGRKKLKNYMIDCKIPREERDSLWLFADGSHVLWLPGFRISETAKVTDETETVLEITVIRRT